MTQPTTRPQLWDTLDQIERITNLLNVRTDELGGILKRLGFTGKDNTEQSVPTDLSQDGDGSLLCKLSVLSDGLQRIESVQSDYIQRIGEMV